MATFSPKKEVGSAESGEFSLGNLVSCGYPRSVQKHSSAPYHISWNLLTPHRIKGMILPAKSAQALGLARGNAILKITNCLGQVGSERAEAQLFL
jgi:hypothetical protein